MFPLGETRKKEDLPSELVRNRPQHLMRILYPVGGQLGC
jgi:hypothetical protein